MTKTFKNSFIILSLVYLAVGLILVIWPGVSPTVLIDIVGIGLIAFGAVKAIRYLVKKQLTDPFDITLIISALFVIAGIMAMCRASKIVELLAAVFGLAIIFTSLVRLQLSLNLAKAKAKYWGILLGLAIVLLAYGVLLLVDPFGEMKASNIWAGIGLIVDAAASLVGAIWTSKVIGKAE